MNENPLVSVIMPVHNAEAFLGNAIQSVIDQDHKDWELIVVDDASSDESLKKVEKYRCDDRIMVIPLEHNSGSPAKPRNVGVELASGRYIAFIDADDLWLKDKLQKQISLMQSEGARICCCSYQVVDEQGETVGHFHVPKKADFSDMLRHNTIGCLTAVYDCNQIGKRYFPECGHEDYALWLDILSEGGYVLGVQETLAQYRVRAGSVSSNKLKTLTYFWHIYRHRVGYGIVKSAWLCLSYAFRARNKYARTGGVGAP